MKRLKSFLLFLALVLALLGGTRNVSAANLDLQSLVNNIPAVIAIGNLNTNPKGGTTVTSTDRIVVNELLN